MNELASESLFPFTLSATNVWISATNVWRTPSGLWSYLIPLQQRKQQYQNTDRQYFSSYKECLFTLHFWWCTNTCLLAQGAAWSPVNEWFAWAKVTYGAGVRYPRSVSKKLTKEGDGQSYNPPIFGSPVWKTKYFIYVTFILIPEQGLNWHFCDSSLWLHVWQVTEWCFTNQGMYTNPSSQDANGSLRYINYCKTPQRSWRTSLSYFRGHLALSSWATYAKPLYLSLSTEIHLDVFCLKTGCP